MRNIWIIILAGFILVSVGVIIYLDDLRCGEIEVLKQELKIDENYLINNKKYWVNDQDFVDWKIWRRETAEREAKNANSSY